MTNFISRLLPITTVVVDVLLIWDLISDIRKKRQEEKQKSASPIIEEEPVEA